MYKSKLFHLIVISTLTLSFSCSQDIGNQSEAKIQPDLEDILINMISKAEDHHAGIQVNSPPGRKSKLSGYEESELFPPWDEFEDNWQNVHKDVKGQIDIWLDLGGDWSPEIQTLSLRMLTYMNRMRYDSNLGQAKLYYLDLLAKHDAVDILHMTKAVVTIYNMEPDRRTELNAYILYITDTYHKIKERTKIEIEQLQSETQLSEKTIYLNHHFLKVGLSKAEAALQELRTHNIVFSE